MPSKAALLLLGAHASQDLERGSFRKESVAVRAHDLSEMTPCAEFAVRCFEKGRRLLPRNVCVRAAFRTSRWPGKVSRSPCSSRERL